jgi:two-component system, cell cycle sensor histidine kinase DivJ
LGNVGLIKSICRYVDALVHPSVRTDALQLARHRLFIAPRIFGSFGALAALPAYLALRGAPSAPELLALAWLMMPILTACFLSRTGMFEVAHLFSALSLAGLIIAVSALTGGVTSFATIWLIVIPVEAALSSSRRVVSIASAIALGTLATLAFASAAHLLPPAPAYDRSILSIVGIVSAALYASGLALGTVTVARASFLLLTAEEERYRLLAHNMTDVITRHAHNGTTLFLSPAAGSLFGAAPADLVGHGLFDRIHVADRPAYLTALTEAAVVGEGRSAEFRIRREANDHGKFKGIEYLWIEMRCRPLDPKAGETASPRREVVAVLRDISERKAREQEIGNARAVSDHANAAKGRFLATISHELRTPLNVIIGFSEMLRNESQMQLDASRRREYAKLINDSGTHLLSVVNGILDMSRLENGNFEIQPEPFALGALIDNCCDLMALKAREAGLELVVNRAPDIVEVVADKRAMRQILLNLLSNAFKFTDPGGRVTVSGRTEESRFIISVDDNGIGIGEEDLPRLGDPFFQARAAYDRRHEGTGLGLSIVKGLVTLHGGQIEIRSRLGKGTQVVVRMPVDCTNSHRLRVQSNVERLTVAAYPAVELGSKHSSIAVKKSA